MTTDDDAPRGEPAALLSSAEAAALAVLDRRAQSAVSGLRAALDRDDVGPALERPVRSIGRSRRGVVRLDATVSDATGSDAPASPRRRARRSLVLVAAAAVAVAAVAAVGFEVRGEQPSTVAGEDPTYLVPGWLPDGLVVRPHLDLGRNAADAATPVDGRVAAYGDGTRDDPWSGPTISVAVIRGEGVQASNGDPITVAGHEAVAFDTGVDSTVSWQDVGGLVEVRGRAVDRATVVAAAEAVEAVDGSPAVATAALPAGWVEIGRGDLADMTGHGTADVAVGAEGLSLTWASDPTVGDQDEVALFQRPGRADAVELLRLVDADSRTTEVRGQRAAVLDAAEGRGGQPEPRLQWFEPSTGLLTTLTGFGIDEATLRRIAEHLGPAEPGEVARLRSERAAVEDRVVASGELDGEPWRLALTDDWGLTFLELTYRDDTTGLGWPTDEPPPPVAAGVSSGDTMPADVVYGVAHDGLSVALEFSDGTLPVDSVDLEGVDFWGFVVWLPEVPQGTEFAAVARDASGAEVSRQPLVLEATPSAAGDGPPLG